LLLPERGPYGTLHGHCARANPQWRSFGEGEVLVVFHGPHAYVSPSWYAEPVNVPTWNYVAVHAYGTARPMETPRELRALLQALVDHHESGFAQPWRMELPEDYLADRMRAIVGFEIPIARIEGKFKLSQNRPPADRRSVARELAHAGGDGGRELALWMEKYFE
jgi:transcriptional regulator